ncbi:MAG: ABC transporter related protein [uncultured bacterium]|uniref:Macrolide ABC transporter ATP-binding protein n=3 Tax=Katanobacteria TaxID=422282 RepID=A0A1F4W344_UNCKA|nr:MAG: ABC transporter related protein [uncultured bacterium]KKS03600.1 MAG: ABC-type antimicrobial peptide transport system, ATPase component [candidate division WWE3 bacterium GW2011_GWC2_41_23]KKS10655.1 MAG: ABC-type antimicrobial peptide transport system, ATPase component [candidate division WWE3 bacterium GW2011_GWF2_41_45]KKS12334.1 MAG: ABC-type antimicrobial peptide transport system, ATPase component [candidate division WWE3 bacterium GW2011_GWF1_41_53]KKS20408.1 MAG: ABC-type antimic
MIRVKDVTKVYENDGTVTEALSGVTFNVDRGEFVAIVGPSGSGKSTLMHILGALDIPTSGEYILNDSVVQNLSDDRLAEIRNNEIGFIFQSYNLLPRMSALKNVILPMMYAGIGKAERTKRAMEVLKELDLEDKINNAPNQLSGGQRQRVAIARALTMNPSILLADEPTGNLPTLQSDEIISLFEKLNKSGRTVLIITHNDEIAARAQRVITLVDGKIVKDERKRK